MNLTNIVRSLPICIGCGVLLLLSGCAKQENIYYWGEYQGTLYQFYSPENSGPYEQITNLEKVLEKAKSSSLKTPPGLHAQLGLLYANTGNPDKALAHFDAEKSLFPESVTYLNFIESKYKGNKK